MKLMYVGLAGTLILLAPLSAPQSTAHTPEVYHRSEAIEQDRVEIIYLPNNTCYVDGATGTPATEYKDYVRACLNNRHLRTKITTPLSN